MMNDDKKIAVALILSIMTCYRYVPFICCLGFPQVRYYTHQNSQVDTLVKYNTLSQLIHYCLIAVYDEKIAMLNQSLWSENVMKYISYTIPIHKSYCVETNNENTRNELKNVDSDYFIEFSSFLPKDKEYEQSVLNPLNIMPMLNLDYNVIKTLNAFDKKNELLESDCDLLMKKTIYLLVCSAINSPLHFDAEVWGKSLFKFHDNLIARSSELLQKPVHNYFGLNNDALFKSSM